MSKFKWALIVIVCCGLLTSGCLPFMLANRNSGSEGNEPETDEGQIQTAIVKTMAAETALAPPPSRTPTFTPSPTYTPAFTPTPTMTSTPAPTDTPQVQPTAKDPWMLQAWCEDHPTGCVAYEVLNQTDSWLQVSLRKTDTGESGFFSIRAKSTRKITLIPGQYNVKFTWWCKGKAYEMNQTWPIGLWRDKFKCPAGYYGSDTKN